MELVQSYHQLNSFISEIRSLRKGFISNLFLHFEKHNLWIEKKELFYQATTEGYFIFRNNSMASYLFYIYNRRIPIKKRIARNNSSNQENCNGRYFGRLQNRIYQTSVF